MNELRDTRDEVQKQRCQICTEDMKVVRVGCVLSCGHNGHVGDATELLSKLESSLAANREQKAEIERLKLAGGLSCELHGCASPKCTTSKYLSMAEKMIQELASLRASVGEKPEDAYKRGVYHGIDMAIGDIEDEDGVEFMALVDAIKMNLVRLKNYIPPYVAPTLPGEEK